MQKMTISRLVLVSAVLAVASPLYSAPEEEEAKDGAETRRIPAAERTDTDPSDGLRKIDTRRYGISVRVPSSWWLAEREREDRAFVFLLPQDDVDRPAVAACEIGVAPSGLEEYQKRIARRAPRDGGDRKLVHNAIRQVDGEHWLEAQWTFATEENGTWHERKVYRIANHQLYTFILNASEKHVEKLRNPFDSMVQNAAFSPPDTGLVKLPDGYWMQRDLNFGLRLPRSWKPAFSPSEQALFFAVGEHEEVLTDNVLVVASRPAPIDFDQLARTLPEELARFDPAAKVHRCEKIRQGETDALETVVETKRGPFRITVLERRFRGARLNYELKYTVLSDRFDELAAQLRRSADSFKEFPPVDQRGVL